MVGMAVGSPEAPSSARVRRLLPSSIFSWVALCPGGSTTGITVVVSIVVTPIWLQQNAGVESVAGPSFTNTTGFSELARVYEAEAVRREEALGGLRRARLAELTCEKHRV